MTPVRLLCSLAALVGLSGPLPGREAARIDFEKEVRPVLEAHCFQCHGEEKQKGKLRLDTLSTDLLADRRSAERWHDVRDALQLGEMPPEKEPPLDPAARRILVAWIEQEIEALVAAKRSTGGRVVLRRLTRNEYQNTMTALLGVPGDYAKNLPPEALSDDGFQNNGATLQMSDLQLEYYLEAAREGLRKAIVDGAEPTVVRERFDKSVKDKNRGGERLDQDQQFVAKLKEYPEEGEIILRARVRARLAKERGYPQLRAAIGYRADVQAPRGFLAPVDLTTEEWQMVEFRGRIENFPLPSKTQSKFPGLLVWLDNAYAEGRDKPLKARGRGKRQKQVEGELKYPQIEVEWMEFEGPVFDQWPPAHHRAILFPAEEGTSEGDHARAVIERFMNRAFRRPVSSGEVAPYQRFFEAAREASSFTEAIRETLAMVLISPDFLYLVEPAGEEKRPVSDWELASRLSYFLWSSMPDERLFELARAGRLREPKVLREEVTRLLGDERARNFVEDFVEQWLDVGAVERVAVNPEYYPDFDNALKKSMRGETVHFFAALLEENLSALAIIDSDFTMLDEPLARHYGLEGPRGSTFERVGLGPDDRRGGVLAHGSVLLGNSTGEDSHPVKRAVWIRERLLDDPPADPPPNVPNLDATDPDFAKLPVREQLALHREEASCNDCHRGIDPWGIALENYGGDGLWRDRIKRSRVKGKGKGKPTDQQKVVSATTLPDGTEVGGFDDLKRYLLAERREQFAEAFTTKLLTYALGRSLELTDEEALEELSAQFIEGDFRIVPLIQLVVASDPFQTK